MEGKQILLVVLIANEAYGLMLKSGILVLCKLDVEQVDDYVNYEFLFKVLKKWVAGHKWMGWNS